MGSGQYLNYNSYDFSYVSESVAYEPVMESGALVGYNFRLTIKSPFVLGTHAAWSTAKTAIIGALKVPKQTITIKDAAANTRWTIAATDFVGDDGPYVRFDIEPIGKWAFYINAEFYGEIPPTGSGTISDSYTDTWDVDIQNRKTYTRAGTQYVATAYTDIDAALDAVDPAPGGEWEYLDKSGTLEEDSKKLSYTWKYIERFEERPGAFADLEYTITTEAAKEQDEVSLTATGKVDIDGDVDGLETAMKEWAKGKLPKNAVVSAPISTRLDKRNGSCAISLRAVTPKSGNVIYTEETTSETRTQDYVARKRLGGGGGWKQKIGDPDLVITGSGRKVGVKNWPDVQHSGDVSSQRQLPPFKGEGGTVLYPVEYTYEYRVIGGNSTGLGTGGAGSGGGSGGSSGGTSGGTTTRPGQANTIRIGNIGGFSTFGLSGASFR